ncbi:MAG: sodium:solute symporter family protein, partial [Prolixibacteraceae bacterium]|nr:sodium:solute symporter family protein [Prolixibacteraceae bacterium]
YFYKRNKNADDYFVGGRKMGAWHIGLSVVATDVGGGFSIGLGGLGFAMGLSGSWLLFTGLIGAWTSAVLLIPKVSSIAKKKNLLSFPQFLKNSFNARVALTAGIISAIGYLGFTSSQILAGAKLASASFDGLSLIQALVIMGVIAVVYTVAGGLKAVIYTDTIQWALLMFGLVFIALPFSYHAIGGIEVIKKTLPPSFLGFSNVSWQQVLNWFITILPIWFIGMTLYQRIYAAGNIKTARKAWFIAGLFEYPVMAFSGALLGMFAKVAFENGIITVNDFGGGNTVDPELGLPLLLKTILPIGFTGIILSSYFSAIMSTADSCLMAASENFITDIFKIKSSNRILRWSQLTTLALGILALIISLWAPSVLDLMLYSYAFMVSGLFVPVLAAIFHRNPNSMGAFWAMILGGSTTLILTITQIKLPFKLDPNIFGISISLFTYLLISVSKKNIP